MTDKHLIVFGENAETQLRRHLDKVRSYREAQWLYDGILYQDDFQDLDISALVFKDLKFAPDALIDNGKWISPQLFSNNQSIWRQAIQHCFAKAEIGKVQCYTFLAT